MYKFLEKRCPKCDGKMTMKWIPSTGMDIKPTGMKYTCENCGYTEVESEKDNRIDAEKSGGKIIKNKD